MPRYPRVAPASVGLSDRVFGELARRALHHSTALVPLHVGDTWREPLVGARAEAQRTDDHPGMHRYAPVHGDPTLLATVSAKLTAQAGFAVAPEHVQIVAGATSGLNVVCTALFDPGEEVIVLAPYWPLIRGIVLSHGLVPVEVPFFDRLDEPTFDIAAALEQAVSERTAAIYVNSPNNPTGQILSQQAIQAIADIAERFNLWVLADEAYEDLWFGEEAPAYVWACREITGRTVACHTVSKSYGLAGARVGYVHGPPEAMAAIRGVQTFQTYCASRPMQVAATAALRDGAEWLAETRRLYRAAADEASSVLGTRRPNGGTFLFFDVSRHIPSDATDCFPFLERCLEAGVLLTPGTSCGRDYAKWARLCFTSVPPDQLSNALSRLEPLMK